MFQMDERVMADNRTLVSIQPNKTDINTLNKNGTINFTSSDKELWLTTPEIRNAFLTKDSHVYDYFDKLILARHGLTIEGSYEFRDAQKFLSDLEVTKNVVIRGNLSVLGESTTVDTPSMTIEDNIIELNKNEKSEGLTLRKAGTALNRGTKGFSRYLYSEDFGGFVLDNSSTIDGNIENWSLISLTEDNGNFKAGDLRVKSALHSVDANLSNNLNVANLATIKNMNITNEFNIAGLSTFNGDIITNGTLTTNGIVNFKNSVTAYKPFTFQDVTTFNANSIMNKQLTNNGLVTMNSGLNVHNSNVNIDTGNIHIGGTADIDSTLNVDGNTTLNAALTVSSNITSNALITGNNVLTQNNFDIAIGNGKGIKFWDSEDYKIFMSESIYQSGGRLDTTSDYNMYFKMSGGTNRGFAFKNGNNVVTQIEGSGIIRTIDDIYSKNSRVLTQADEGEGNHLDADTVDQKHARDLLWRDGSLPMLGDLQMGSHNIKFADNDYIVYKDVYSINNIDRGGLFQFISDDNVVNSVIESGVLKAGKVNIDSSNSSINGLDFLNSSVGQVLKLTDDWIKLNPNNSYVGGVYFAQSTIRTDSEIQIGSNGTILKANMNQFVYKGEDVLTKAGMSGIDMMHGDINMGTNKVRFESNSNSGTGGAAATDYASIYAEHDANSEVSRLVLDIGDNIDDSIILRTNNINSQKNSMIINYNKVTFEDNPYFGSNRILHSGDTGSGHNLDADTVDGKHYADLVNDFVNSNGDTINGKLNITDNGNILNLKGKAGGCYIHFTNVPVTTGDTRSGYIGYGDSSSTAFIISNELNSGNILLLTPGNGKALVNNNEIVDKSMYGHGKGINADMIDNLHLIDLDNKYVNSSGDSMSGDLEMKGNAKFVGAFNYGYACKTKEGTIDYTLYIDSANKVHVGYNNRPIILDAIEITNNHGNKIWHEDNDGHGSGLDADTIDGVHLTELNNRFVNSAGDTMNGDLTISKQDAAIYLQNPNNTKGRIITSADNVFIQASNVSGDNGNIKITGWNNTNLNSFDIKVNDRNNATINNNKILTTADEGHGKGLDADTLDGRHGNDFASADHNHNNLYVAKNEIDLKNKYRILYDESSNSLNFMYLG